MQKGELSQVMLYCMPFVLLHTFLLSGSFMYYSVWCLVSLVV